MHAGEMSGKWLLEQHVRDCEKMNQSSGPNRPPNEVDRLTFVNQEQFDRIFDYQPASKTRVDKKKVLRKLFRNCTGLGGFVNFIYSLVPILKWLPAYPLKQSLIRDATAGLTLGVVHVPQSIAYAVLSCLDPVHGLYTSFFGVLFYAVFGTSKFVSVGSFAVVALMTGVSVREIHQQINNDYAQAENRHFGGLQTVTDSQNYTEMVPKMDVSYAELVQAITFTSGLIHLVLGILRVEFLVSYLSDQLVNGFCTGAAIHVVVAQLGELLEIPVAKFSGPSYILRKLYDFATKISMANPTASIISAASFVFLYIGKDRLNTYLRGHLPAPIPFELILIIITTIVSAVFQFHDTREITIVEDIPTGLPSAKLPRFDLIPYVFGDALEIAFVVVALHLSMCRIFNRRMGTKTDNNQELYAMSFVSILSSFFTTYPTTSAIGRTMLSIECGGQSQLSAIFTAAFLLIVILFFGPFLSNLPMCVLAVIIIYSIKNVFRKMPAELMNLWQVARIDFMIWIVAFLSTVVLNVMQGLVVSVLFALITTIFRIQWPRWKLLSRLSGTEEYRDAGRYSRVTNVEGVRIFRFDAPLLFTNVEHFAKSVEEAVQLGTEEDCPTSSKSDLKSQKPSVGGGKDPEDNTVQHFIIDCSGFTFVDYTSATALADIYHQMETRGICMYFAGAKATIRDSLEACGFYGSVERSNFYPTIHDAVNSVLAQRIELAQAPPDPAPPPIISSAPPPLLPLAKSARSLINNPFMSSQSSQSIKHPMSESGRRSAKRIRSPTNWVLDVSPLAREGRSGSEWATSRVLDELDDV